MNSAAKGISLLLEAQKKPAQIQRGEQARGRRCVVIQTQTQTCHMHMTAYNTAYRHAAGRCIAVDKPFSLFWYTQYPSTAAGVWVCLLELSGFKGRRPLAPALALVPRACAVPVYPRRTSIGQMQVAANDLRLACSFQVGFTSVFIVRLMQHALPAHSWRLGL
jgi:hypothetical protein